MKTEIFTCNAGNGQAWSADGLIKVIRYESGNAGGITPTIRIKSLMGNVYDLEMVPGRQVRLPEAVRGIVVQNISGAASLSGKLTLGAGDITDNSIVGEVSVIDSAYLRTLAQKTFGHSIGAGPVAGQYSHCQVFNNSATKNLVIESISLSVGVASGISFGFRNAAIAVAGAFMPSKLAGGALSTSSRAYTENSVADLLAVTIGYRVLDAINTAFVRFDRPLIVPNGWGFIVRPSNVNTQLTVVMEASEEPV